MNINAKNKKTKVILSILVIILIIVFLETWYLLSNNRLDNLIGQHYDKIIKDFGQRNIEETGTPIKQVSSEDVDIASIAEFTDAELKYLDGLNFEPQIQFIRTAFNTYLATGEGDSSAIATENSNNCGLDKFREYINSKFVAFQVETAKDNNGLVVSIIFPDKPDKIFEALVLPFDEDKKHYLIAFCAVPYSEKEVQIITKSFGRLLRNEKSAL